MLPQMVNPQYILSVERFLWIRFFSTKLFSIWVMVFTVSGLSYKMVEFYDTTSTLWTPVSSPNMWGKENCYLDDWMTSRCCFDGSSTALCFIMCSVVGFGLHLYLQLILAKLAWQWPI